MPGTLTHCLQDPEMPADEFLDKFPLPPVPGEREQDEDTPYSFHPRRTPGIKNCPATCPYKLIEEVDGSGKRKIKRGTCAFRGGTLGQSVGICRTTILDAGDSQQHQIAVITEAIERWQTAIPSSHSCGGKSCPDGVMRCGIGDTDCPVIKLPLADLKICPLWRIPAKLLPAPAIEAMPKSTPEPEQNTEKKPEPESPDERLARGKAIREEVLENRETLKRMSTGRPSQKETRSSRKPAQKENPAPASVRASEVAPGIKKKRVKSPESPESAEPEHQPAEKKRKKKSPRPALSRCPDKCPYKKIVHEQNGKEKNYPQGRCSETGQKLREMSGCPHNLLDEMDERTRQHLIVKLGEAQLEERRKNATEPPREPEEEKPAELVLSKAILDAIAGEEKARAIAGLGREIMSDEAVILHALEHLQGWYYAMSRARKISKSGNDESRQATIQDLCSFKPPKTPISRDPAPEREDRTRQAGLGDPGKEASQKKPRKETCYDCDSSKRCPHHEPYYGCEQEILEGVKQAPVKCEDSDRCESAADHESCYCAPCLSWQGCQPVIQPRSKACKFRRKTADAFMDAVHKAAPKRDHGTGGGPQPVQQGSCGTCGHHKGKKTFHESCPRLGDLMFIGGPKSAKVLMEETSREHCGYWVVAEPKKSEGKPEKDSPQWLMALTETKRRNNPGWLWEVWKIDPAKGAWLYEGAATEEEARVIWERLIKDPEQKRVDRHIEFIIRRRPAPKYQPDDTEGPCRTCTIECLDDNNGCREFDEHSQKLDGDGDPPGEWPSFPICIISCGKAKIWDNPGKKKPKALVPAQDAYTGPLFTSAKNYAEQRHRGPWYILSDKYGLISPGEEIENYEISPEDIRDDPEFFDMVQQRARSDPDLLAPEKIILIAGKIHQSIIERAFPSVEIINPVQGLTQGERMKALKNLTSECASKKSKKESETP